MPSLSEYSKTGQAGAAVLRVDQDRITWITRYPIGDGFTIALGTYKQRGRTIIFYVYPYHLNWKYPGKWDKGPPKTYKYKILPNGDLVHPKNPINKFRRQNRLSREQEELLDLAPSWIEDQPSQFPPN